MVRKSALARLLADEPEERRCLPLARAVADGSLLAPAILRGRRFAAPLLRFLLARVLELLPAELGLLLLPRHRGRGLALLTLAVVAALAFPLALRILSLLRLAAHQVLGAAPVGATLLVATLAVLLLPLRPV